MTFQAFQQPDGWAVLTDILKNPVTPQLLAAAKLKPQPTTGLPESSARRLAQELNRWNDGQSPRKKNT